MKHQLFIGIDRSDKFIDICVLDPNKNVIKQEQISSDPAILSQWVTSIQPLHDAHSTDTIAICIEQPCRNLTNFFKQYKQFTLYLINPVILKRYRETFNLSRSKDDKKDALHLALLLTDHHQKINPWSPSEPSYLKLTMLTEKRRQLVDARTAVSNKLTQNLKEYYPQALDVLGKYLFIHLSISFLRKWTSLQSLKTSKLSTIKKFYYQHKSRSTKAIEKRLKIIEDAIPLCSDPDIIEIHSAMTNAYIDQLEAIQKNILYLEEMIKETHLTCPNHEIIDSLPGAGQQLSPRITAFMGMHSETLENAEALQCQSGIAPVTKQSGKTHFVYKRYACPIFARQTFVEFAGQSYKYSTWANAYYGQQKQRGKSHQVILRSLAYKWQRIIFKCWKDKTLYNEEQYIQSLKKSGSALIEIINQQAEKKCA